MTAVLAAALVSCVLAGPALAHAVLVRTDPPDGVVLSPAPTELHLWFSEAVLVGASSFSLVASDGHGVPLDRVRPAGDDGTELVVDLPALSSDAFRLDWRAVSADDLHVSSGSIVFGVGGAAVTAPAAAAEAAARPDEIETSWLGFVALAGLLGALVVGQLLPRAATTPGAPRDVEEAAGRARRRLELLALVAACVGSVTSLLTLWTRIAALGAAGDSTATSWQAMLGSPAGLRSLASAVVLGLTAAVLAWRLRHRPRAGEHPPGPGDGPWPAALDSGARASRDQALAFLSLALVAPVLVILRVLSSHAAGATDPLGLAVVASATHVFAAAVWIGGLAALVAAVTPLLASDAGGRALAVTTLRRFGWVAAACLGATLVTGLLLGGALVPSLDALLSATYGHVLLIKIGLAAVVALLGLANAASLHPSLRAAARLPGARRARVTPRGLGDGHLPTAGLHRRIRLEAAGALVVAGLAATLAATPPAAGTDQGAAATGGGSGLESVSGNADDLMVTFAIRPNRPGRNFVTVGVYDTRRPAPAPVGGVVARLQDSSGGSGGAPTALALVPAGAGRYEATVDLASAVPLAVSVVAERPGLADAVYATPWSVLPGAGPSQARSAAWQSWQAPLARAAAVAGLAFLLLFAAVAIQGLRRPARGDRVTLRRPEARS